MCTSIFRILVIPTGVKKEQKKEMQKTIVDNMISQ